jgi:hypothetical protein
VRCQRRGVQHWRKRACGWEEMNSDERLQRPAARARETLS